MPDPGRVDAPTGRVDDPGAVAVRDHPGKGHLGSQPAATFLGVTGIHSWEPDPHPDLTRIGLGVGQVTAVQDLAGRPLLVIPNGAHDPLSRSRSTMRSRLVPIGRESFRCRVIGRPEIAAAGPNVIVALRSGPS